MTKIDWEDWNFLLQTLSVDATLSFLHELALPLDPYSFPRAKRFARACLEAEMYSTTLTPAGHADSPGFIEAWRHYRRAEGVLSDEQLRQFLAHRGRSLDALQHAFHDFAAIAGAETCEALRRWLIKHSAPHSHLHFEWVWAVRRLVVELPEKACLLEPCPLTAEQMKRVVKFIEDLKHRRELLELRFYIGGEAARFTPPTPWEQVLLTFPADGPITERFWLQHVGSCLQLRLLRREWGKMSADLGAETTSRLTAWVRRNFDLWREFDELPDEPAPN
ncbi:MAG TPA: hypothetical protein VF634_05985 [Pyrinomonadaceae bacterium]